MGMSMSGFAKSASTWLACAETGVRARRFRGRLERGSADVGMDSGIGSDMVGLVLWEKGGYACGKIRAMGNVREVIVTIIAALGLNGHRNK